MDRPAIHACEAFAKAGYPLDAEAMLIIEVEGSVAEQDTLLGRIKGICERFDPISLKVAETAEQSLAIWKGRKGAFGAVGRISPDYLCMDGTIPTGELPHVLRVVGVGQQARVHLRVQRLDPAVHHFRKAGMRRYLGDRHTTVAQQLEGAAGRQQFDAARGQSLRQFDDAGLVGDGQQGAARGQQSHGCSIGRECVGRLISRKQGMRRSDKTRRGKPA